MNGSLHLIGTGPGDLSLLPEMARRALEVSDVVTGYSLYLDLLRPLLEGKEVLGSALTQEEERAALAIDKCLEGKNVALVSSGDIGIYGMASLVFELLERRDLSLDVWVVPGISAINSAAALLGAPMNHDFCAISLSDLLTPWPLIERRIEAAAAGDFNVVFYNPASEKRNWQLNKAVEILLQYRAGKTPVGLVRNAFRKDQKVRILTLEELPRAGVDMLTTVIVGNSTTRRWKDWIFTPRGYKTVPGTTVPGTTVPGSGTASLNPAPWYQVPSTILEESFRIIRGGMGPHNFSPEELAVAVRVIHSTGDFAMAPLLRFQNNFFEAMFQALQDGQPIITDGEMTRSGISRLLLERSGSQVLCMLNDAEVSEEAKKEGLTRSAYALRKAAQRHPQAIFAIGTAPTALLELLSLTAQGLAKPSAVIGVPVGFVSVVQSKEALLQSSLAACTIVGRRGGSGVAAAVVNACLQMTRDRALAP